MSHKSDVKKVVEYLWADEERHYEESRGTDSKGKAPRNHIFTVLKRLNKWLKIAKR